MRTLPPEDTLNLEGEALETELKPEKPILLTLPGRVPFFWLALAGICGSLAAEKLSWPAWAWLVFALAAALSAILDRNPALRQAHKAVLALPWLVSCFAFCAALYTLSLPGTGPQALPSYHDAGQVTLRALLIEPPAQQIFGTSLTVQVLSLQDHRGRVVEAPRGQLLIQTQSKIKFTYGDLLLVRGELRAPPEGSSFSYQDYLAHQGVWSYMNSAQVTRLGRGAGSPLLQFLYRIREHGAQVLDQTIPYPESALLRGMLLGDESAIPEDLQEAYALTGTAHVIAISGFNMAILAGLVARLFQNRLGPYLGLVLTFLVLWLYSLLVGASASVMRAALMGSVAALGASIGRRGSGVNALGFSALIMLFLNPHLPWDIGFQLSAMATLGILLFSGFSHKKLQAWLSGKIGEAKARRWASPVTEYLLITLIAQGMVMPLLAYHFRNLSPLFLIANPLVLPVQGLGMVLGLIAMSAGLLFLPLGNLLAWVAWLPALYTNRVVAALAAWMPTAYLLPRFSFIWVVLVYALLVLLLVCQAQLPLRKKLLSPGWLLPLLILLSALAWLRMSARPDGNLTLTLHGTADAPLVYLRLPEGQNLLLSTRMSARELALSASKMAPIFDQNLDLLIIPACKAADLRGYFELPTQMRIQQVLWACDPGGTLTGQRLVDLFAQHGISTGNLSKESGLGFGADGQIQFTTDRQGLASLNLRFGSINSLIQLRGEAPALQNHQLAWLSELGKDIKLPVELQFLVLPEGTQTIIPSETTPLYLPAGENLRFKSDGSTIWQP